VITSVINQQVSGGFSQGTSCANPNACYTHIYYGCALFAQLYMNQILLKINQTLNLIPQFLLKYLEAMKYHLIYVQVSHSFYPVFCRYLPDHPYTTLKIHVADIPEKVAPHVLYHE